MTLLTRGWVGLRHNLRFGFKYGRIFGRSLPLVWQAAPQESLFLIVILFLQGLIPALSVWINKQVVDNVAVNLNAQQNFDIWVLMTLVMGWAIALFLENLLPPWQEAADINLDEKLRAELGMKLMQKADSFVDLLRFEDSQFYDELQIIQEEMTYEPSSLLQALAVAFRQAATIMAMLALLLPLGWWLPLLIVTTSFPQIFISFRIRWKIWETLSDKSVQARRMQYYSSVMLTDTYAKEIRLFGLGNWLIQRYQDAFRDKFQSMHHLRGRQAVLLTGLAVLSSAGNAFVFFWIVLQAVNGKLTPGNVLLFVQSLAYTQDSFLQLMNGASVLQRTLLFMERLFKFLDSQPTMVLAIPGKPVPKPIQTGIVFDQVSFLYPDGRPALDNLSFTFSPGETVALVGENGAGKTTLVKLLARLYDPTHGTIWVDGEDLKNLDLVQWRQQLAVIFQDFCRYSLTIGDNIALGDLSAQDNQLRLQQAAQQSGIATKVTCFLEGYQTMLGKQFDGTELSGGEWQKVALARAFIRQNHSQILVLDEPTAALDPRSEYEIYCRFAELVRGKTAILVTHRLASVRMCDRVLVLKSGQLLESGTHEQLLLQQGEYAALWNMQAQQYEAEVTVER
jgi:ATP-binding cassette, subfamily B, bacterial